MYIEEFPEAFQMFNDATDMAPASFARDASKNLRCHLDAPERTVG